MNKFNSIDAETRVIMNGLPFIYDQEEQRRAQAYAKERITAFGAGLAKVPSWVNTYLTVESGDPLIHIRWDFELDTWILERWIQNQADSGDGYWIQIMILCNRFNQTPRLNPTYMHNLVQLLKKSDMQRVDPAEYIRSKRNAANMVKEENRKAGERALAAAIDAMSMKQIKNFIDVHTAIHTGETIVAHGADEKSLAYMTQASQQAMKTEEGLTVQARDTVPVNKALNQGMHPKIYHRTVPEHRK